MSRPKQKQIRKKEQQSEPKGQCSDQNQSPANQQKADKIQSLSGECEHNQQSEESPPIEAAIKSMKFRSKRGAKMKDLMKGKIDKDQFWDRNNVYFGGDLKGKDEDEHESQYEASSSGRDEFDSDFDLTDSYPGKRGRKKGQKIRRRNNKGVSGRGRGRPKKVQQSKSDEQNEFSNDSEKEQIKEKEKKKKIYKKIPNKPSDVFIIYKVISQKKKSTKSVKQQKQQAKLEEHKVINQINRQGLQQQP